MIIMDSYILRDEKEVRARWKDYFASLLESDQNSNEDGMCRPRESF